MPATSSKPVEAAHVIIRVKPRTADTVAAIDVADSSAQPAVQLKQRGSGSGGSTLTFPVNGVLQGSDQQSAYTASAADLVACAMHDGYSTALLAYGQTGAGKTFSMCGGDTFETRGIIPRAIEDAFHQKPAGMHIHASFLEIYNETLIDLLADSMDASVNMSVRDDPSTGGVQVKGLTLRRVESEQDALAAFFEGTAARAVAEHALNAASSRSHCVFTLHFARPQASAAGVVHSKAHFVDLAGSERVSKTESSGAVLAEAKHINKSLTFLEQVVLALTAPNSSSSAGSRRGVSATGPSPHIPYRSSKLTHVLRDALGGHARLRLLACVWPDAQHAVESASTLRFATRMMRIKCTLQRAVISSARGASSDGGPLTPGAGVSHEEVHRLRYEVSALRRELAMYDALNGRTGVRFAPVSAGEAGVINGMVAEYLDAGDSDDDAYAGTDGQPALAQPAQPRLYSLHTWRQIRYAMRQLRCHAQSAAAAGAQAAVLPAGKQEDSDSDDHSTRTGRGSSGTPSSASRAGTARATSATGTSHANPAQRAQLARWQAGPGVELNTAYQAARRRTKDAKTALKDIGTRVNELKARVDRSKAALAGAQAEGSRDEVDHDAAAAAAADTKAAKQDYKAQYMQYQTARQSLEDAKLREAAARADMMAEFDAWVTSQPAGAGSSATTSDAPANTAHQWTAARSTGTARADQKPVAGSGTDWSR